MRQRRKGGIKICPEFAEIIQRSAQKMIKIRGRVNLEWVEVNKELALQDEMDHKEIRFLQEQDAQMGDKSYGEISKELKINIKKWRERK